MRYGADIKRNLVFVALIAIGIVVLSAETESRAQEGYIVAKCISGVTDFGSASQHCYCSTATNPSNPVSGWYDGVIQFNPCGTSNIVRSKVPCTDQLNPAYSCQSSENFVDKIDQCQIYDCTASHDGDGDSWGNECCKGGDCNDADGTVYPGATEVCTDGKFNDCNRKDLVDCNNPDCTGTTACSDCPWDIIQLCEETLGYLDADCICHYRTPILIDPSGNGFALSDGAGGVNFDLAGC